MSDVVPDPAPHPSERSRALFLLLNRVSEASRALRATEMAVATIAVEEGRRYAVLRDVQTSLEALQNALERITAC